MIVKKEKAPDMPEILWIEDSPVMQLLVPR